jgi:CheY-like chemotaxis protein
VRVPLAAAAAEYAPAESTETGNADAASAARRILVVDDNIDAADALGALLGIWGHEVEIAHNGISALTVARRFDPELIFLDIGLPEMNGYEVARRLRQEAGLARTKFIALSGYGTERDRRRSKEAGFELHLIKPVDPRSLPAVIASVFAPRT